MDNKFSDAEWVDHYLRQTLNEEEKSWIRQRLASDPDFIVFFEERKLLIEGIRYAHLRQNLLQLRALEKKLTNKKEESAGRYEDVAHFLSDANYQPTLARAENDSKEKEVLLQKTWRRWPVAAAITFMVLTYLFVLLKQPPRPMECLVSIVSFHKCF
jgi:hypothetical protein